MQTFSANGLAERLERDRATVVKALRNIPADRTVKGKPQWKIATGSRAVEAHLRAYDGNGGSSGGGSTDPRLSALHAEFDKQDAAMRALPTLEARRAAARAMAPLIEETSRAFLAHGRSVGADPELMALKNDKIFVLIIRGTESPCEWTFDQAWEAMNPDPETADA
jgi:hypothetical protein